MIYIGIDPGLTGAVAVIGPKATIDLIDAPVCEVDTGKKNKKGKKVVRNELIPQQMANVLDDYQYNYGADMHVFIEKVHSMKDQGVASTFNFGMGFGIWIGILAALKIPHTFVTPQAWKKATMQGFKDKDASRIRAQQLFPQCVDKLNLKKHVGRSDALLIAEFGRRSLNGR
jgi:crossover junction endodeoxyribonuclease RuvC